MKRKVFLFLCVIFGAFCFAEDFFLFKPTDTICFDRATYVKPADKNYLYFLYKNDEGREEARIKRLDTNVEAILNRNVYFNSVFPEYDKYIAISTTWQTVYITKDLKDIALKELNIQWGTPFFLDVALIKNEDGYFLINSDGKILSDQIARSSARNLLDGIFSVTLKDGRAGFMNLKGELVFEVPQEYKDDGMRPAYWFSDDVMVLTNGLPEGKHKNAVIDMKGNILGETTYFLSNFSDGLASFEYTVERKKRGSKHPDRVSVFGYMDKYCNVVIPAIFEIKYGYHVPEFDNGYAEVNYHGRDLLLGKDGILYSKEDKHPVFNLNKLKTDVSQLAE